MITTRRLLVLLVLLAAAAAPLVARADEPPAAAAGNPLAGVNMSRYELNREKGEIAVEVGRRFLADLKAVSPAAWASVTDAVRLDIQQDETAKFARQKNYVIYAYGAIWVILIVFVVGLYTRQRHLAAELAELERRVGVEKK
jgi:CcmD family protein